MSIKKVLIVFLVLLNAPNVWSINVGKVTEIMPSDKNMMSKNIINTIPIARFVSLTVDRISSPFPDGKILPIETKNEILFTPSNLILSGNSTDIFKIIYNGPKDDQERYYYLNWTDAPIALDPNSNSSTKNATVTASALISTILVVAPRIEEFSYHLSNDYIENTGNVTFRLVVSGPCKIDTKNKNSCNERYYVMPKTKIKIKKVNVNDAKASIGIWHNGNFITIN